MEADRFSVIAQDEQRAVQAINEEYLRLQDHVAPVPREERGRRGRALALALALLLVVTLALAGWLLG